MSFTLWLTLRISLTYLVAHNQKTKVEYFNLKHPAPEKLLTLGKSAQTRDSLIYEESKSMPEKFAKIWPFFKIEAKVEAMGEKWEFGQTKKMFKYQFFYKEQKCIYDIWSNSTKKWPKFEVHLSQILRKTGCIVYS